MLPLWTSPTVGPWPVDRDVRWRSCGGRHLFDEVASVAVTAGLPGPPVVAGPASRPLLIHSLAASGSPHLIGSPAATPATGPLAVHACSVRRAPGRGPSAPHRHSVPPKRTSSRLHGKRVEPCLHAADRVSAERTPDGMGPTMLVSLHSEFPRTAGHRAGRPNTYRAARSAGDFDVLFNAITRWDPS